MNLWKFAAFVTGLVVVTAVVKKLHQKARLLATDSNHLYSIDDFIDEEHYPSTEGREL